MKGLDQQRKWMRIAHEFEVDKVTARINTMEQIALSLGYERIVDRNGRRIGLGQMMPSVTELIRDVFDEEDTYRL